LTNEFNFMQLGVFRDCILVPESTTIGELAAKLHPDMEKHFLYAESIDGLRLGEDHVITRETSIRKKKKKKEQKNSVLI
jgi:ribosome-binding ATPase